MCGGISLAGETANVGAGQMGITTSLAYDASHLSYREYVNDTLLDKLHGWLYGGFLEARYDNRIGFVRGTFNLSGASVTFETSLQPGNFPLTTTQSQLFYQLEADLGYKALNFSTATLAPYVGLGYRYWRRGQNNLPDYEEDYAWWYGVVGANLAYRYREWLFGLDTAIDLPIGPGMTTNVAGLLPTHTFILGFRPGFRIEAPVSYDVYKGQGTKLFVFGTPYYQLWNVGASDTYLGFQEPESSTGVAGFRLGIGVNF
jgi:hypothetical protein